MKKILIFVPIIAIITVIIVMFILLNNNVEYEIEEVGKYKYFKLYENEKYGVIDFMRKYNSRCKL